MSSEMSQTGPYPTELFDLVAATTYRPGWRVDLRSMVRDSATAFSGESRGLTLVITTNTVNSYEPHDRVIVNHFFPVPPATYIRQSWQRWLFEQFLLVERHECMEFFTVAGIKPYAPNHGPGNDPYTVTELTTDEARRTSFRGEVQ